MIRESHNAVVARNEDWQGAVATEPYEVGWAGEAIIFLRALDVEGTAAGGALSVQISPDGMHWVDEGTRLALPARRDEVTFARIREFGNWLRVAGTLPKGFKMRALVTISLKV